MKDFLDLFFDEGEEFCVSPNQYAFHSVGFDSVKNNKVQLISPNPKVKPETKPFTDMTLMALNPIKGFRLDENVTAYRNFLIEMDEGDIESQLKYIKELKIPYSCAVFSGNKSVHFGVCLDQDLGSLEAYNHVAKWLLAIASKADQQTVNPSRCIRLPEAKRGDKKQILLEIKPRITLGDLQSFLSKNKDTQPIYKVIRPYAEQMTQGVVPAWIKPALKDFDNYRLKRDWGRNDAWFRIFAAFAKSGKDLDSIIDMCEDFFEPEPDFKRREWVGIARSAYKNVHRRLK